MRVITAAALAMTVLGALGACSGFAAEHLSGTEVIELELPTDLEPGQPLAIELDPADNPYAARLSWSGASAALTVRDADGREVFRRERSHGVLTTAPSWLVHTFMTFGPIVVDGRQTHTLVCEVDETPATLSVHAGVYAPPPVVQWLSIGILMAGLLMLAIDRLANRAAVAGDTPYDDSPVD
jgi:hypothetical protein